MIFCKQAQQPPEDGDSLECSKVSSAKHYLETLPREATNSLSGMMMLKQMLLLDSALSQDLPLLGPLRPVHLMCMSHEGSSNPTVRRPTGGQDRQKYGVKGTSLSPQAGFQLYLN